MLNEQVPLASPHVVFLDHVALMSGGEIALVRLARALKGHVKMTAILGEDGPLRGGLEAEGVQVIVLALAPQTRDYRKSTVGLHGRALTALASAVRHAFALRRLLEKLAPDIVHSNSLKSGVYGGIAARLAGVPLVWHLRDRLSPDYLGPVARVMMQLALRWLASAVICNSAATAKTVRRTRDDLVVIPDPYDPPPAMALESRRTEHVIFGVVGRLTPWKGQDVAITAFSKLRSDTHQLSLVGSPMFGEQDYEEALKVMIEDLALTRQVTWTGFTEDVHKVLITLDVLVHASVVPEPFGQVVVEGMAAGLPVIATEGGGPSEIITPGVDGLLVPGGDVEALSRAMERLAGDYALRWRLARAARQRASAFESGNIAPLVLSIYRSVC